MGTSPLTYFGIPVYGTQYKTDGTTAVGDFFKLNWNMGAGAPAAVIAQDFKLMGEMFRQCEIEFDVDVIGDRYLTSRAVYFHEWFRLLGMLILSGNYHAPSKMVPSANMKIYMSVDKTFAYPGDLVTYTFSYRNYGKLSSTLTQINNLIPIQYEFVSATGGGTNGGASVLWNLGTIPGFNGTNLSATQGSVTVTYRVKENATGRVCNTATISTQGVVNWTNNEYPNNVTELMERNCVDITQRPLYIQKSSNREFVNPGQEVEYTLDFGNASIPFLNGGRPGVVLAFANTGTAPATQFGIKLRLYHGAEESYINYKNYRISYFISDASTNWSTPISIYEGGLPTGVTVTQQNLNPGTDANGAWNQRLIFQFADQLCTTTPHLGRYYGLPQRIHRGGAEPLRAVWRMHLPSYAMVNWADDWSAEPTLTDADDGLYYPITNDWTDPNNPNIPINRLHPNACDISTKTTSKILVEEWDGYTWRRVFGNGPVSGREVQNVVVEDVLPNCVTWNGFVTDNTLGVTATYNPTTRTVRWTIPVMRINDVGRLKYKVVVNDASCFGGCPINNYLLINEASIEATNESKLITKDTVIVTCNPLPPVVPPSDLIKRVTSSGPYSDGSTVTYELEYTNVNGSIADPNLSTSADWTRQSGSTNFNFASNQMTTVNSPTVVMTYGYSHGTNGTMTGTINVVSSATIGIAFRHIGGGINNGLYVTLKPNFGAGNVEVRFWNGTTPLSTATYGITAGPVNYKIVLNGGTASLWLNNFNGTPLAIQTGLPIRAGYAGILNGDPLGNDSYASHQITDFYTNLDSAFGLQFYDPVPSGLTYVSSSNSGVLNAGVVQWPVVNNTTATPLLAGQTLRRTWTATISTCNGDIYNIGYLKIRGITPDLAALATINCNTSLPLDWLYFSALPVNGLHELTWATANEREVKDFIIQVSTDGKIFEDVQSFPAQNRSLNQYKQSIIPRSGVVHYYRIKEVSIDASVSYSSIQVINTNDFTVQLFPTPFEYETIVAVYTTPEMTYTIQVFDASGKLVQGGLQYSGSKEIKLGSSFAVGSYIIEITNSNKVIHQKIIKY